MEGTAARHVVAGEPSGSRGGGRLDPVCGEPLFMALIR